MSRTQVRVPDREQVLTPVCQPCPVCGQATRIRYENRRTLVTLTGTVRLRLKIRRCEASDGPRIHKPYRPETEGAPALPQHEFGFDLVTPVGALRHREHRSVPEIHSLLLGRGVAIIARGVTNLVDRYDEVSAAQLADPQHLRRQLAGQDRIVLVLDGLHQLVLPAACPRFVLWVSGPCASRTSCSRTTSVFPVRTRTVKA